MTSEALANFWQTYAALRQKHHRFILFTWGVGVVGILLLAVLPGVAGPVLVVAGPILFAFYLVLMFQNWLQTEELPCPECGESFVLRWTLVKWRPRIRCGGCGVVIPRSA